MWGIVIVAQNAGGRDYVQCARALAASIRRVQPGTAVCLLTDHSVTDPLFDSVIRFPWGDVCQGQSWRLANDWQVFWASPYEYTLKLEADMILPQSIEHWFPTLCQHDLVLCTTIRDHRGAVSSERFYRAELDRNGLPDIYNAITYFRKSDTALEFYSLVRTIFTHWPEFVKIMKIDPGTPATTDTVYGLAARILGPERCTLPQFTQMSMVHCKQAILGTMSSRWTDELLPEITPDTVRIQTFTQRYPIHYHVKEFADTYLRAVQT